jgi:hypothetical protein
MRFSMPWLLSVLSLALVADRAAYAQPREVPLVRSWGELLEQEPIKCGGAKVRFGIESTYVPADGAVMFYALIDGRIDLPAAQPDTDTVRLGPFVLRGQIESLLETTKRLERIQRASLQRLRSEGSLELHLGIYQLSVFDRDIVEIVAPNGRVLAEVLLRGGKEVSHPWFPWAKDPDQHGGAVRELVKLDDNRPERYPVQSPLELRPAVAAFDAESPAWLVSEKGFNPKPDDPLPRWLNLQPTPRFQLRVLGNRLTLTSERPLTVTNPRDQFLSRWWVNDRPVLAQKSEALKEVFDIELQLLEEVRRPVRVVQFDMTLAPAVLGAKRGDKIGLQLLYTPSGWRGANEKPNDVAQDVLEDSENLPGGPNTTNRVEFVVE